MGRNQVLLICVLYVCSVNVLFVPRNSNGNYGSGIIISFDNLENLQYGFMHP